MKAIWTLILAVLMAASAQAGASISGTVTPPGRVEKIQAFEREGAKLFKIHNRYHDGKIDPKTGRFEIADLPDGTYQLLLDCGDLKIEGIDVHVDDEEEEAVFDYVFKGDKLTTKRLDLSRYIDPDEAVSEERKKKEERKLIGLPKLIEKLESLKKVDRFCDHLRPLYAHGTKKEAFVLVEKARLRDFHAGHGEAIWRAEIWMFRRYGPIWDQPRRTVRVLQRHRFKDKAAYRQFGALFEPRLGGIKILKGKSVTGIKYTIPDKWDDAMGKVPADAK
ncbi:MAG: hypothetical protein ACOC8E_03110 [Planctomycetota bacterium]